eukprot:Rmarinus@m.21988
MVELASFTELSSPRGVEDPFFPFALSGDDGFLSPEYGSQQRAQVDDLVTQHVPTEEARRARSERNQSALQRQSGEDRACADLYLSLPPSPSAAMPHGGQALDFLHGDAVKVPEWCDFHDNAVANSDLEVPPANTPCASEFIPVPVPVP